MNDDPDDDDGLDLSDLDWITRWLDRWYWPLALGGTAVLAALVYAAMSRGG